MKCAQHRCWIDCSAGGNIGEDAVSRHRRCFLFSSGLTPLTALVKYFSNLSLDQNGHIVNFFNNLFSKNIFSIGVYFLPLSCYTNFCCSACPRTEISAPVAQLDRALDSDSKGHWFESSRAYQEEPLETQRFQGVLLFVCTKRQPQIVVF